MSRLKKISVVLTVMLVFALVPAGLGMAASTENETGAVPIIYNSVPVDFDSAPVINDSVPIIYNAVPIIYNAVPIIYN